MSLGRFFSRGISALHRAWSKAAASGKQSARRQTRRRAFKRLLVEPLEGRDLLAADFLYSLESRPGVPDDGFGFSLAANDQFHVVANFAALETYYFLEDDPDYDSFFYGEIQVHDAATGELLRTIQNPLPFGNGDFGGWGEFDAGYEFNFRLTRPNAFGYSIDIYENLILVGSPGWDSKFSLVHDDYDAETGGKAFLFDANTGDLLHTFDGSFEPVGTQGRNNDGFGRSVSIDGNRIVIGAPGPNYEDDESQIWDTDPGHVYVYSATTGNELHLLEPPNPNQVETLDFGTSVSLSDGKLVVTQGDGNFNPIGPTRIYDVPTGDLLHTLPVDGFRAVLEGNDIAVYAAPNTKIVNATTGSVTHTIPAQLLDFDGNLIVSGTFGFGPSFDLAIRDFPSGNALYSVPTPPNFSEASWEFSQIPQLYEDRLLVPGRQGAANENVVFVYSLTDGPENGPPTDLALTNNSVPENSANGTVVGTLSATDPDSPETFTFALLDSANGRFSVNGNQLVVAGAINFESTPTLQITVQVTDSAGNAYSEIQTITVTDIAEPPLDLSLTDRAIREGAANGTLVSWIDNVSPHASNESDAFAFYMAADAGRVAYGDLGTSSVIITDEATGDLLRVIKNPAPPLLGNDFFGAALDLSGDLLVVSARHDDVLAQDAGIAYVFNVATGQLLHTLQHPAPANGDRFGWAVSIHGSRIVVGASGEGSAFVFSAVSGNLLYSWNPPGTGFGQAVQITEDYVAVGDFNDAGGAGRVYIYAAADGAVVRTLDNPNPANAGQFDDGFGIDLVVMGERIVVGSYGEDGTNTDSGAAYVFNLANGNLIETILPASAETSGRFGSIVNANGSTLAVGRGSSSGVVELFNTTNWQSSGEIDTGDFPSGFGLAFVSDGLLVGTSPTPGVDRVRVYNPQTLLPRSAFRVLNPGVNPSFTFTLLDDAGGRFALVGDQVVVADSSLLDAEVNPSHTVIVRVTNAQGLSLEKPLTIHVIANNDAPTDITLSGDEAPESSLRLIHNLQPEPNRRFGDMLAAGGNRLLIADLDSANPNTRPARVAVIDTTTGQRLATLVNPNPVADGASADGFFGFAGAITGNLAVIPAAITDVGNADSAGVVYVFDMTTGAVVHTLTSPAANKLRFGFNVAASGNIIAVGSSDGPQAAGVVYLYNATNGALMTTINNPHPDPFFDAFGSQLAISGNTLVIAASLDDQAAADTGRAYLYHVNPATFQVTLVSSLNNPTPASAEFFGTAVAVAGDLVAVSVVGQTGSTDAGEVYVFSAATGNLLRTIPHPAPAMNDAMGSSLAFSGPYLIASSRASNVGSPGRAYVFQPTSGELVATIHNPSPEFIDGFGRAIVTDGNRVVISAPLDDTDGTNTGMVYVYDLAFGQPVGTLNTTDLDPGETFTYALINDAGGRFAIDGNQLVIADATKLNFEAATSHNVTVQVTDAGGNTFSKPFTITVTPENEPPQDIVLAGNTVQETQVRFLHNLGPQRVPTFGYATEADGGLVVVGANNLPVHNLPGEVSVYNNSTGELVSVLAAPSSQVDELFGENVAISGNLVVVGARNRDAGIGAAYVYNATTGALLHTLINPTPASSGIYPDFFGSAIAISGNLIAIGSEEDLGAPDSGAVYLFDAVSGNLLQTIASPIPSVQSKFGNELSLVGNTLVVGASLGNRAYIFEWNSTTQSAALVASLTVPPGGGADSFGGAVTIVGNIVAVGARNSDVGAANSGQVHLFDRATGSFLSSLDNPSPNPDDLFGQFIASNGTHLAVAAQNDDTDAVDSGRVYIFNPATGELLSTIANPSPNGGDFFSRLAYTGNTLIVGSPTDDSDGFNAGMTYIFDLPFDQVVGNLATIDPDSGDSSTYTLLDDANGRFKIVGGSIVVAAPAQFNFESNPTHSIQVRVTDAGGLATVETLIIQVTNSNEAPQDIAFAGNSIAENAANGTLVSTLSAIDPDANSTFTYSLVDSAGGRFGIVGNTIVVANSSLLDFETATSHTVTVRATDAGGKFVLESLRISVLDGPEGFDYGDLPNSFGTTLAANGSRHIAGAMRLGATKTNEPDGQPSANANLDAGDDGVTLPPVLIPGLTATFSVEASQPGRLDVFLDSVIDDGQFTEDERLTTGNGVILSAGTNVFSLSVPAATGVSGSRAIRFRFSFAGGLGPTGLANEGEVEDYRVNVAAPPVNSVQLLPDPDLPWATLMVVTGSQSADTIVVAPFNGQLRATINGVNKSPLAPLSVSRIVIFGRNGNDDIRINNTAIPGYIDGGGNNDTIRGGNGPDRLFGRGGYDTIYGRAGDDEIFGGDGNDTLYGDAGLGYLFGEAGSDTLYGNGVLVGGVGTDTIYGSGHRNLLIGSEGADTIYGANANQGDILIAGGMIHQSNLAVLKMMHNEWRKTATVATRIANLNGTTPGGLNGTFYLNASTLYADAQIDKIYNYGANNANLNDWVFRSLNDKKYLPKGIVVII